MAVPPTVREELREIVGDLGLIDDRAELLAYECDGFPIAKAVPAAVLFPTDTRQVAEVVRCLNRHGVVIVPRGSGTGLTGGCVGFGDGVIVCTSRMTRMVQVDLPGRWACVQAGVRNEQLTEHVQSLPDGRHLHFAPDPSSQRASTIGGNAATNAGGLHTLKYGVSANHVLGLELVTPVGDIITTRPALADGVGPDLPGLVCGSEGTLGFITRVWVRLTAEPRAFRTIVGIFDDSAHASQTVADIIATGIVPAALEMMDGAMVRVVEDAFHYGFPRDAAALLLIEIDGVAAVLDEQMQRIALICRNNHATRVDCSADPGKRAELWSARKRAFGAIGRISPSYCTQDACVPRSRLPEVLAEVSRIGKRYGLTITNVFHAGDGNVHPILLFDEDDPRQVRDTMLASHDILAYCISIGGTLTGEHGVGVEKLPMMKVMFSPPTLELFARVKHAFDPDERLNLGKLIPSDRLAVDLTQPDAPVGRKQPGGALA